MSAPRMRWAWLLCLLLPALAGAGQDCSARRPDVEAFRRSLELAAETARRLDALGAPVVVLARAGQDLSSHGLRYSHLGIAYHDPQALGGRGAWRVVHKLNRCGSDRGELHRQGLAEFFSDGLHRYEAGVSLLQPPLDASVAARLRDNRWLASLHEPRYNMLAYPWGTRYQQSNQWALETLAHALHPALGSRREVQHALARQGYLPDTVHVPALQRLGARVASAHIAFDDQPFARRMAGQIDTVTVESVLRWLDRRRLGSPVIRIDPPLESANRPLVSSPEKAT